MKTRFMLLGLCAVVAASCSTRSPAPSLMSPIAETGTYGYREHRLDPSGFEITYVGPRYRLPVEGAVRRTYADAAVAQAFEMALWRAAEIALAEDSPGFVVTRRSTDLDLATDPGGFLTPVPYPFDDPFHPLGAYRFRHGPLMPFRRDYVPPSAFGQGRATIAIRLVTSVDGEAHDARRTIDTLRARLGSTPAPVLAPR